MSFPTPNLLLKAIKLGDNADTSKNFIITVPTVADGTLTIQRENGGTALLTIDAAGIVRMPAVKSSFVRANSGATTIPTGLGANTTLASWVKSVDGDGAFDTSTGKYQPTVAGWYQVNATVNYDSIGSSFGIACACIDKNSVVTDMYAAAQSSGGYPVISVSSLIYMNGTTDYLKLGTRHNAVGSINNVYGYFEAILVRAA